MMDQGDHLVEGVVERIHDRDGHRFAQVTVRGARVEVLTDLVPDLRPGDRILFQGKVALARVEEVEP